MVMAVLPGAAYAQLTSAEYTVNTGEIVLNFDTPYDPLSTPFDRIQITDGTHNVTLTVNNFVLERPNKLYLDMDPAKTTLINNMNNPVVVLNEGAVRFNGVGNIVQSVPITGIVQVGAIIPDGHEDIQSVVELSTDHFNQILERYDASWRLDVVLKDGDDQIVSLLELQQANINVVIGTESLLAKNRIAQLGMTVIVCCATSTDYDIIHGDPLSFAIIPDESHALEATLTLMSEMGVNRILPVYPADERHVLDRIKYLAQVAVADGIQYGFLHSSEQIASLVADTVVSDLVSVPDIKLGILLTNAEDAPRILEAASQDRSLTRAMWFGQSPHTEILNNEVAASFAQDVRYSVPYPGGMENPFTVSLDSYMYDKLNRVLDKTTFGAYDVVQIVGLSILGNADIHENTIDTFASLNFEAQDAASMIPSISTEFGGYTTYTGLEESGGLEAPVYQMQTVRGDDWVQIGIYNNPRHSPGGTISFGDAVLPHAQYTAGEPLIHDVVPVGLMVHEYDEYEAGIAARMGLALLDDEYSLVLESVTDGNIAGSMELFDDVDIPIVLVHAPELSLFEASQYAQSHDMLVIGTASTTKIIATPNDNTFRMLPSDVGQARALAGVMQHDNIQGVVAIYPDRPEVRLLLEDVAAEFAGEIDMTNSYNDTQNVMRNAILSTIDMSQKYDVESTAILVMGGEDTVDMINNAIGVAKRVNWYGSVGMAGSHKILNEVRSSVNLAALSPAISDGGHAQLTLDSLYGTQLPMYTTSLFEAARVAGVAIVESDSSTSIAKTLLSSIADDHGLIYDHIEFDGNGDLALSTYDIWWLNDDAWTRDSTYDVVAGYVDRIPIGVLVPLTGPDAQRGIQQMWGAHLAISSQNEILKKDGVPWRLSQEVMDTATSPDLSLDAARTLHNSNIQVVLGPPDTMSVDAIGEFGTYNDLVLVSCCSDELNIDNTSTISLGSTTALKSQVAMHMINDDNITNLLIIHSGNSMILDNLIPDFDGMLKLQEYGANDTYNQIASDAEALLSDMLDLYDRSSVGVLLLANDADTASILAEVLYQNNLQYVNWYGLSVDGALPYILSNQDAITAAASTNFAVAAPAIPANAVELETKLRTVTGFIPSSDAYLMYDAATLLSATIIQLNGNSMASAIAEIMPLLAQNSVGITGPLALDENNQRLYISHDVWSIIDGKWWLQKTIR